MPKGAEQEAGLLAQTWAVPILLKSVPKGPKKNGGPDQLKRNCSGLYMDDLIARSRSLLTFY